MNTRDIDDQPSHPPSTTNQCSTAAARAPQPFRSRRNYPIRDARARKRLPKVLLDAEEHGQLRSSASAGNRRCAVATLGGAAIAHGCASLQRHESDPGNTRSAYIRKRGVLNASPRALVAANRSVVAG